MTLMTKINRALQYVEFHYFETAQRLRIFGDIHKATRVPLSARMFAVVCLQAVQKAGAMEPEGSRMIRIICPSIPTGKGTLNYSASEESTRSLLSFVDLQVVQQVVEIFKILNHTVTGNVTIDVSLSPSGDKIFIHIRTSRLIQSMTPMERRIKGIKLSCGPNLHEGTTIQLVIDRITMATAQKLALNNLGKS